MMGWLDDLVDEIGQWFFDILIWAVTAQLDQIATLFEKSVGNVQSNIVETPMEFSPTLVDSLRTISETAVMPVAGVILTYVFCYEIYTMVAEKNKGNDFDTREMFFLIFKTAVVIFLVTNSFDITLAFFDLGAWMTNQISITDLAISSIFESNIADGIENGDIGLAITFLVVTMVCLLVALVMSGMIYIIAWSRMITILMYISIAPLPFATLMNRDWVGSIGQSYIKQILALMLQGFFMMICLVVYAGLLEKVTVLIADEGSTIYGLLLMMISMGVLVLVLTRTHATAKSVLGVV